MCPSWAPHSRAGYVGSLAGKAAPYLSEGLCTRVSSWVGLGTP